MRTAALSAGLITAIVGTCVLYANPRRFPNQAFAALLILCALFLGCVYMALVAEAGFAEGRDVSPVNWLIANNLVAAFLPWATWMLKESIISQEKEKERTLFRSIPWLCIGLIMA